MDFNIKEISHITDDFDSSILTLEIYGKNVNYTISILSSRCLSNLGSPK